MGILGDIFSGIDTQKRKLNDLLSDPLGAISQKLAQFGEDQNSLLNLQANAYPMAGDRTVLNSPDQIAQFRQQLAEAAGNQAMSAATVWHGSPHKFDAFDASKIGTGEGAQAYGHGLYLADAPGVAGSYTKAEQPVLMSGAALNEMDPSHIAAAGRHMHGGNDISAISDLQWSLDHPYLFPDELKPIYQRSIEMLKNNETLPLVKGTSGNMYKVDLPDEHIAKMLNYDAPFAQQPKELRDMLAKYDPETYHPTGSDYDASELGQQTLQRLQRQWGETKTAAVLQGAGIPGIKYFDGGSRSAGNGTQNYVIFPGNEGLLSILERNGVPAPTGIQKQALEKFVYPQDAALAKAQINAAKPISEGGLGLHPDNTPMERARAMGFDTDTYHGTSSQKDFSQFENPDAYTTPDASQASEYAFSGHLGGEGVSPRVMPIMAKNTKNKFSIDGHINDAIDTGGDIEEGIEGGISKALDTNKRFVTFQHPNMTDGLEHEALVSLFPRSGDLRSRFAAFDPSNRNSADLLAGLLPLSFGLAPPDPVQQDALQNYATGGTVHQIDDGVKDFLTKPLPKRLRGT